MPDSPASSLDPARLSLRQATPDDLGWVEEAVRLCPATMSECGGFYGSATQRLAPLLSDERVLWLISLDGAPVGFVDADRDAGLVNLGYYVVPAWRRRGIASAALRELATRYPDDRLHAAIESANAASISTAEAAGLRRVGTNTYGEFTYERAPLSLMTGCCSSVTQLDWSDPPAST